MRTGTNGARSKQRRGSGSRRQSGDPSLKLPPMAQTKSPKGNSAARRSRTSSHGSATGPSPAAVSASHGHKLEILSRIQEREEAVEELRSLLVRWPVSHESDPGYTGPGIPEEMLTSVAGRQLAKLVHRVRWLGVDIVRGLQALAAGTKRQRRAPQKSSGAAKAFMWNGQVYVDKMAMDCDFCVDMLKHDAVGLFTASDPLMLGPGGCHILPPNSTSSPQAVRYHKYFGEERHVDVEHLQECDKFLRPARRASRSKQAQQGVASGQPRRQRRRSSTKLQDNLSGAGANGAGMQGHRRSQSSPRLNRLPVLGGARRSRKGGAKGRSKQRQRRPAHSRSSTGVARGGVPASVDGVLARALYSVGALEGEPPPPPPACSIDLGPLALPEVDEDEHQQRYGKGSPYTAKLVPDTRMRHVGLRRRRRRPRPGVPARSRGHKHGDGSEARTEASSGASSARSSRSGLGSPRTKRGRGRPSGGGGGGGGGRRGQPRQGRKGRRGESSQHRGERDAPLKRASITSAISMPNSNATSPVARVRPLNGLTSSPSLYGVNVASDNGIVSSPGHGRPRSPPYGDGGRLAEDSPSMAAPSPANATAGAGAGAGVEAEAGAGAGPGAGAGVGVSGAGAGSPTVDPSAPPLHRVPSAIVHVSQDEVGSLHETITLVMSMVEIGAAPVPTSHTPHMLRALVNTWRRPHAQLAADFAEFSLTADVATVRAALRGVLGCIEYLIAPGLAQVRPFVAEADSQEVTWNGSTVEDLVDQVGEAAKSHHIDMLSLVEDLGILAGGDPGASVRYPSAADLVACMLRALHVMREADTTRRVLPASAFKLQPLNDALRLVMAAAWRGDAVSVPPRGGFPADLPNALLDALVLPRLGLGGEEREKVDGGGDIGHVATLLDGVTKAMILHPVLARHASASAGGGPLPLLAVRVHRDSCFEDSYRTAVGEGVVRVRAASEGKDAQQNVVGESGDHSVDDTRRVHGSLRVLQPFFKSSFDTGGGGGARGNVEEGEGHGPRKEFFSLLGTQLDLAWLPERLGVSTVSGKAGGRQLEGRGLMVLRNGDRISIPPHPDARQPGARAAATSSPRKGASTGRSSPSPRHAGGGSGTGAQGAAPTITATVAATLSASEVAIDSQLPAAVDRAKWSYARPCMPIMSYRQGAEGYWPRDSTRRVPQAEARYEYLGWLLAACVLNRSRLSVRFPRPLFSLIMAASVRPRGSSVRAPQLLDRHGREGAALRSPVHSGAPRDTGSRPTTAGAAGDDAWDTFQPSLHDLSDLDPELVRSAASIQRLDDDGFAAVLEAEGADPNTTKEEFVAGMVHQLVVESVEWQVAAMRRGFRGALGDAGVAALRGLGVDADDLVEMVCGPPVETDFEVDKVFRVVARADAQEWPELLAALWAVIRRWPVSKKRKFLAFVTGIDRLPAPHSEELVVELPFMAFGLEEHKRTLGMLPQAHTCTNTLELPNYQEALAAVCQSQGRVGSKGEDLRRELERLINEKLTMAMENTAGYGLDTLGGDVPRGSFMLARPAQNGSGAGTAVRGGPGGRVQHAASDSDDDDDGFMIPILGDDIVEATQPSPLPQPRRAQQETGGKHDDDDNDDDDVFQLQIPTLGDHEDTHDSKEQASLPKAAPAAAESDDGYSDDEFAQIPVLGDSAEAAASTPAPTPAPAPAPAPVPAAAPVPVVADADDDADGDEDDYSDDDFAYDDDDFDDED